MSPPNVTASTTAVEPHHLGFIALAVATIIVGTAAFALAGEAMADGDKAPLALLVGGVVVVLVATVVVLVVAR